MAEKTTVKSSSDPGKIKVNERGCSFNMADVEIITISNPSVNPDIKIVFERNDNDRSTFRQWHSGPKIKGWKLCKCCGAYFKKIYVMNKGKKKQVAKCQNEGCSYNSDSVASLNETKMQGLLMQMYAEANGYKISINSVQIK